MPQRLLRSKRNKLRFANTPNKRDHFTQGELRADPDARKAKIIFQAKEGGGEWVLHWLGQRDPPPGTRYVVAMETRVTITLVINIG